MTPLRFCIPLLAACLSGAAVATDEARPIRFAIGTNWGPPLAEFEGERLRGGLLKTLIERLDAESGGRIKPVFVPRVRLELLFAQGEVDLSCFVSPRWLAAPDSFHWAAQPLLLIRNVLIGHAGTTAPTGLDELPAGTVVGTVRGYRYPSLDARFADGRLRRDDAPDELRQAQKLMRHRAGFTVMKDLTHRWLLSLPEGRRLASWQLKLDETPVFCAVPKASGAVPGPLLELAAKAAASPAFQRELARYRSP